MNYTENLTLFPNEFQETSLSLKSHSLKFLEQLVGINSQTKNKEGVNLVQHHVQKHLSRLGFETSLVPNLFEESGDLLIAEKKGLSSATITFIGHADTVLSPAADCLFEVDPKNNEVRGPGIGDDKGGLVMALAALENFLENHNKHYYTIVFVSSPNEEMGSVGFQEIFKGIGERSLIVFGLEPALMDGALISSRNGNRWYDIEILGRPAHAGRFGEPFVNAAHHAAEFISRSHALNDIENKIKVNVGSISSGIDRYNVVCDKVSIKLDARFPSYESRDFLHYSLEKYLKKTNVECFYTEEQCQVSYKIVDDCPPLPLLAARPSLIHLYAKEIESIESCPCRLEHSGGAADINYFYRQGLIYLDGIGPVATGMHTKKEVMKLDSFFTRRLALENILTHLENTKENSWRI
ncbi:MAG: M20/M25/M40 family metallo-hydrolase [Bacteriovorax sp.]